MKVAHRMRHYMLERAAQRGEEEPQFMNACPSVYVLICTCMHTQREMEGEGRGGQRNRLYTGLGGHDDRA